MRKYFITNPIFCLSLSLLSSSCTHSKVIIANDAKHAAPHEALLMEGNLVGVWSSTNAKAGPLATIVLKTGGRFMAACSQTSGSMVCGTEGKWRLRNGTVVWIYDSEPSVEDVNQVTELAPDKFVIREMDGSLTTMTRIK